MKFSFVPSRTSSRQTRRALLGLVSVSAAAALVLTGCSSNGNGGGDSPAPSAAAEVSLSELETLAKKEGEIVIYTNGSEDSMKKFSDVFAKKYGIDIKIFEDTGGPLFQRFSQEVSANQVQNDILILNDRASLEESIENRWLEQYTPKASDEYSADDKHDGYYYPIINGFGITFIYNTDKVSAEEIKMLQADPVAAIQDKRFKGRLAVNPPSTSPAQATLWYVLAEGSGAKKYGWKSFEKIAANDPGFFSTGPLGTKVMAGEYAVGVGVADSFISRHVMSGAPVEFVYPNPTASSTFGAGIVKGAKHPNAARLFMEWATTAEANQLYSEQNQNLPLNTKAKDNREISKFPWYEVPKTDWKDAWKDPKFLKAMGPDGDFIKRWSDIFGYSAN